MSYCTLDELKRYLISGSAFSATSAEDELLQQMLDNASSRIDSFCQRRFYTAGNTTRYFDPLSDVSGDYLFFDDDLAHLTSVTDGGGTNITSAVVTQPRNVAPYYGLKIKSQSSYYFTYNTDHENAIEVTGRWAYMNSAKVTAISRDNNTVTATCVSDIPVNTVIQVLGFTDSAWSGQFTVLTNTGTSITWHQTHANGSDGGGYILYTPVDIFNACRRLAAWFYRQKDTQQGDTDRPILAGDGSVLMPSALPKDVTDTLKIYQRRVRN